MSNLEIMFYYANEGVNLGHKPNRKRRILFFIPEYDDKCGGIVAVFNLARIINEISNKLVLCPFSISRK
jgi:hypothetical protein